MGLTKILHYSVSKHKVRPKRYSHRAIKQLRRTPYSPQVLTISVKKYLFNNDCV